MEKKTSLAFDGIKMELLKVADAKAIWPYVSDPEVSRLMSWDPHKSIDTTIEFLKGVEQSFESGKAISWGIYLNEKIVGVFSLISILKTHRSLTFNKAELAYWLAPEFQGKGIMTKAGVSVLNFAFKELGLNKVYVGHHEHNEGSRKLIERLGFRFSHIERNAFMKNNEWINVYYYEMLSEEFKQIYN